MTISFNRRDPADGMPTNNNRGLRDSLDVQPGAAGKLCVLPILLLLSGVLASNAVAEQFEATLDIARDPVPRDFPMRASTVFGRQHVSERADAGRDNHQGSCSEWQWRNPLPYGHNLHAAVVSDEQAIVGGDFGTILVSNNLWEWNKLSTGFTWSIRGMTEGSAGMLVVGLQGGVALSTDGESWTDIVSPSSSDLFDVEFGAGRYVAVGDEVIVSSPDGVDWTVTEFVDSTIEHLVFADGQFLAAASDSTLLASQDGITWDNVAVPLDSWHTPVIAWNGESWMATIGEGVYLSGDLEQWTEVGDLSGQSGAVGLTEAFWLDDRFMVTVGSLFGISEEGSSWEFYSWGHGDDVGEVFMQGGVLGAVGTSGTIRVREGGAWLDVGSSRRNQVAPQIFEYAVHDGAFLASAVTNGVYRSDDGEIWQRSGLTGGSSAPIVYGVSYHSGTWYAMGLRYFPSWQGVLWESNDRQEWIEIASFDGQRWPRRMVSNGSRVLMVGNGGFLRYSDDDGETWSEHIDVTTATITDMVWASSQFVGVTGDGEVLHSPDGESWSLEAPAEGTWLSRIRWTGSELIVVGAEGLVMTSSDAVNWQTQTTPTDRSLSDIVSWNGQWLASGESGVLLSSSNGQDWMLEQLPTNNFMRRLIPRDEDLLAAGPRGTILRKSCAQNPDAILSGRVASAVDGGGLSTHGQLFHLGGDVYPFETDPGGYYAVNGLPAGDYAIQVNGAGDHPGEVFTGGRPCFGNCTRLPGDLITLGSGDGMGGVNFMLPLGGRIAGTVVDSETEEPDYATARLHFFDELGWHSQISHALGNEISSAGEYLSPPLHPGTYYVQSGAVDTGSGKRYQRQLFDGVSCPMYGCDRLDGTPVNVVAGEVTSEIDLSLVPGGVISGTVADAGSSLPLSGVDLEVFDMDGNPAGGAFTNENGEYSLSYGLAPGDYRIRTGAGFYGWTTDGYVDQLYSGVACPGRSCDFEQGMLISIDESLTEVTGIDFALEAGETISGQVLDQGSGDPLLGMLVIIYDDSGRALTWTTTDSNGQFDVGSFPPGTYYAISSNNTDLPFDGVSAFLSPDSYIDQLYDGLSCPGGQCDITSGTPIEVGTGGSRATGIDFSMTGASALIGQVIHGPTSAGLPGIELKIYDTSGELVGVTATKPNGTFRSSGLPAGEYFLLAKGFSQYWSALYPDYLCAPGSCDLGHGEAIEVQAGLDVSGIVLELWADRIFRSTFDASE